MKYKVGDKVRIVSEMVGTYWVPRMGKWLGKVMTVREARGNHYYMEEDTENGSCAGWYEHMIAGLADEPKNYIPEIAKRYLGVDEGEEFDVPGASYNPYKIIERGLTDKYGCAANATFMELLRGDFTIKKLPWKPKNGELYYWVSCKGIINNSHFDPRWASDIMRIALSNYFHTHTEAEANTEVVKERLGLEEWVR